MERKEVRNILTFLANLASEVTIYDWTDKFKLESVTEGVAKAAEALRQRINIAELTEDDCDFLQFGRWETRDEWEKEELPMLKDLLERGEISQEDYDKKVALGIRSCDVRLFPLWMYNVIPDGTTITYIDGTDGTFKKRKTDNDMRFGILAYGIIPKKNS